MTISIWRYSHLVLSIFSSLFLIVVSVTGCFLSLDPIIEKSRSFYVKDSEGLSLSEVVSAAKSENRDVVSLKRDINGSVILESEEGEFYINPFTGEQIGIPEDKMPIFKFMTSLHRSLFLNSPGRAVIGITSFLLFLIATSGVVLVVKRQGSVKKFFASIVKESYSQYLHIIFGRITLIPVVVLSLTGSYLSLKRFGIIPDKKNDLRVDYDALEESDNIGYQNFEIFRNHRLENLRQISFPLFEDVEEFYHLKLKNKEFYINQFTGKIESEGEYPFTALASNLSFNLHTGQGSIIWSLILGLSMISIPYFIYSGFAMTIVRRRGRIKNVHKKNDSECVILVGSENGSTQLFGKMFHEGLLKVGKTSYLSSLNNYSVFKNMRHMVVFTSTYGAGEPPTNAAKFTQLFRNVSAKNPFKFSVVGFGSLSYPDFCKFAYDVDECIDKTKKHTRLLDVHTVNNKSFESFSQWVRNWGDKTGIQIQLSKDTLLTKRKKTTEFETVYKTDASDNQDDTFLVKLKSVKKHKCTSGDLLAVYPKGDDQERLYSMAVSDNSILLSIKRHQIGVCSNYLNDLELGERVWGYIIKNKEFHFPNKAKSVIMIATGTGIAPFLGMIENNHDKREIYLYWGAKNHDSFVLYENIINDGLNDKRLTKYVPAYSRAGKEKVYVQNLVERDNEKIVNILKDNGVIMICGSVAMQKEVMKVLDKYVLERNGKSISYYKNNDQIRMDCY